MTYIHMYEVKGQSEDFCGYQGQKVSIIYRINEVIGERSN